MRIGASHKQKKGVAVHGDCGVLYTVLTKICAFLNGEGVTAPVG